MYASPSARCHASSPSDRPPASGRKSYCVGGSARKSLRVFSASRSHVLRNISSSFIGIRHLFMKQKRPGGSQTSRHTIKASREVHPDRGGDDLERARRRTDEPRFTSFECGTH